MTLLPPESLRQTRKAGWRWLDVGPDSTTLAQHLINIETTYRARRDEDSIPENMMHSSNVCLMLAHRLRRWPNIKPNIG